MPKILLTALASLIVSSAVGAQTPAPGAVAAPAARAPQPVTRAGILRELDADFGRIDANHDGMIDAPEATAAQQRNAQQQLAAIQRAAEQRFARLDTDRNGQLSLGEYKAGQKGPSVVPALRILQALDTNKDQRVSQAEFRARRLATFDRRDANHDGVLSPQEQRSR